MKELREEKNVERIENNKKTPCGSTQPTKKQTNNKALVQGGGQPPSYSNYIIIPNSKYIWNINVNPYK